MLLLDILEKESKTAIKWFKQNVNPDKFQAMVLGRQAKGNNYFDN